MIGQWPRGNDRFKEPTDAHTLTRKLSRFAVIGGLSSGLYLAVMLTAVHLLQVAAPIASVTGYMIALPLSFLGQRRFTFVSADHWRHDLIRYLVMIALSVAASLTIVWVVSVYLGWPPIVGGLATILCIPVLTYLCMDLWVFRLSVTRAHRETSGRSR